MEGEEVGIESRIQQAMISRVQHFRDQADSLTFEKVRRLLEKDMDLDMYALDVHKRYVKQLLEKFLNESNEDDISKESRETAEVTVETEAAEQHEEPQTKEDVKEPISDAEEKLEESPVMGLLTGNESAKSGNHNTHENEKNGTPSWSTMKKAIWKRAAYFKAESSSITLAGVRRLLEEDLELPEGSVDIYKKLISSEMDKVLVAPKNSKTPMPAKKKSAVDTQSRSKKISRKVSSDSSDSESDHIEDDIRPKQKNAVKSKAKRNEVTKKRKRPAKETMASRKKQNKLAEETSEDNSNTKESGDESEDGQSQSSVEKPLKKKEALPPAYGKRVEHLKSIIKSCGMSVAPSIYKKAKQVPDSKREAFVIKELEDILSREGLSTYPSEKEIKEVKRRKERAKELEGIDTSNIVLNSRRRSSFAAPPKPKEPVESDGDDTEDTDNDDDNDNDDDENGEDDSQSEDQEENEDSD